MASGSAPKPKVSPTKTVTKTIPLSGNKVVSLAGLIKKLQDAQTELSITGGTVRVEVSHSYYSHVVKGLIVSGRVKLTEAEIKKAEEQALAEEKKKADAAEKKKLLEEKRKEQLRANQVKRLQNELVRVQKLATQLGITVTETVEDIGT